MIPDTYLFVEKEQWISVEEKCHRSNVTQSQIISTVVCCIYVFTQNVLFQCNYTLCR